MFHSLFSNHDFKLVHDLFLCSRFRTNSYSPHVSFPFSILVNLSSKFDQEYSVKWESCHLRSLLASHYTKGMLLLLWNLGLLTSLPVIYSETVARKYVVFNVQSIPHSTN
ncbi:uncharacterized protein [Euphorbia lathyris]|uniref:uncharacterized protein n=1 Tax=Euphorbia lathyris TaxID=212925 RepID=UPI003313E898